MRTLTARTTLGERDPFDALANPVVKAAVDQAMEPYRGMVSAEMFEEMRESLADFLTMHPVTDRLIRRLQQRANVVSGEERIGPPTGEATEVDAGGRKVG